MAANDTGAIFTNKLGFGNKPSLLVIKSPWAMYGEVSSSINILLAGLIGRNIG